MTTASASIARRDFAALRDRRVLVVLPIIVGALLLPFVLRAFSDWWLALPAVPFVRVAGRAVLAFALVGAFPAFFLVMRLGLGSITVEQHRALLRLWPIMMSTWTFALAIDGFFVIAWPERVAIPGNVAGDLLATAIVFAVVPLLWGFQTWSLGFDVAPLLEARATMGRSLAEAQSKRPIDTLDYRVLQLVASSGGDLMRVMINDMGIGHRDLMLRLQKLVALGYVDVVVEMHGPQIVLATAATDALALPVALFTWDTDDAEMLRELATARLALEERQAQKVVVACARCCERMLRSLLALRAPEVTVVGGKELSKATLGELIGACRAQKLVGKFEENVFAAVNERRKKIHQIEGEKPIDEEDAFFVYTLTEIAARAVAAARQAA